MKNEIIFQNPTKYARVVQLFREEGVKDPTTEQIVDRYVQMGGAYIEDNEIKNVIGNPQIKSKSKKEKDIIEALPKMKNPKPRRTKSNK